MHITLQIVLLFEENDALYDILGCEAYKSTQTILIKSVLLLLVFTVTKAHWTVVHRHAVTAPAAGACHHQVLNEAEWQLSDVDFKCMWQFLFHGCCGGWKGSPIGHGVRYSTVHTIQILYTENSDFTVISIRGTCTKTQYCWIWQQSQLSMKSLLLRVQWTSTVVFSRSVADN